MNTIHLRRFVVIAFFTTALGLVAPIGSTAQAPTEQSPWGGISQVDTLRLAHVLFEEVFNDGDADAAAELIAADAVFDTPSGTFIGPEGLLEYVANVRDIYLDASFDITSLSVTEETVAISWRMTATQYVRDTIELVPVELTGVYTITVGDGEVAGLSEESEYLIVAGPSVDIASLPPEIAGRGQPS